MNLDHYITPDWPAPENVRAASTTRMGGNSSAPFDSFNLGFGTDNPEHVKANRSQLTQELQLQQDPFWLQQIHSNEVISATNENTTTPKADASFTSQTGVACVVMTADCMPVLICNRQGTKVAAVHAGWRGLAAGIIENTLKAMNANPHDTLVWLGPAIGSSIYEVGEEVVQQFLQFDRKAELAFIPTAPGKYLANLYLLAKQRLAKCNVQQIYGEGFCTFTDQQRFFSSRRDQGKTGRMASLIWLAK